MKKAMLFTNDLLFFINDDTMRNDYEACCLDNNVQPTEEGFMDFIHKEIDFEWDEFNSNMPIEERAIVTGTLGLWDGTHEIYPCECTLGEAIRKCCNSADTIKFEIDNDDDDFITVTASHHDGTNHFQIQLPDFKGDWLC